MRGSGACGAKQLRAACRSSDARTVGKSGEPENLVGGVFTAKVEGQKHV